MTEPASKRLKLDAIAATHRLYSADKDLQLLAEWVIDNGGYFSDNLELYKDETNGYSVRVISYPENYSQRSDELGSLPLVSCPTSIIFSLANPKPSLPSIFLDSPSISDHAKSCFHLSQHILLEDKSPHWPYIKLLPSKFDTPLYFNAEEMVRLAGTNLGAGDVALRKSLWMEEWEMGVQALKEIGNLENIEKYTWDLYLRSATLYTSRSFPSQLVGITQNATAPSACDAQKHTESFPVLIPLVDILNHQPSTKIVWKPTPESFSLEALGHLPIGSQVFNNYGPKANEELLMGYGFVIPGSPVDSLAMKFTMLPRDPMVAAIWEQRESKKKWSNVFHLTKSSMTTDAKIGIYALENDWPEALVDLFRLLVINELELETLKDENSNKIPISTRNELAVALGLKQAMTQKLSTLRKYDSPSNQPPRNQKERSADIYRQGQQDIMVSKLEKLDNFITNYAPAKRLSSGRYLSDNERLKQILKDFPIPTGVDGEGDDEGIVEFELIEEGELVLLIAILREYFLRENGKDSSHQPKDFWDQFMLMLGKGTGMSFDESLEVDEQSKDNDNEEVSEIIADYCNMITSANDSTDLFNGHQLIGSHISWAWDIVKMKCINLDAKEAILTI
ncbi:hypothetical protein TWF694_008619 [Orbilia ellipsospora]|uniref:SET domain-containing protein n=1 Tax=Orbilia ellipsospora TaxID=2528407 RepID=A0AAV9XGL8_9PEZI